MCFSIAKEVGEKDVWRVRGSDWVHKIGWSEILRAWDILHKHTTFEHKHGMKSKCFSENVT